MADRAERERVGEFMSQPQQQPETESVSVPPKPSWKARIGGWAGSILRSTPARALGLIAAFAAVTAAVVWLATQLSQRQSLIEQGELVEALEMLDSGEIEAARDRAAKLFAHGETPDTDLPGALFIFGAALIHDARATDDTDQQRRLYLMASRYLEEACRRGLPAGRETEGLELLSRSLFESGRYAKALPYLRQTLQLEGEHQIEQQRMLVEAYVRDANPQWARALEACESYLANEQLGAAARRAGTLLKSRIEFALDRFDDCRRTLEAIPDATERNPELLIMRARLAMHEAAGLRDDAGQRERMLAAYQRSMELLRRAMELDRHREAPSRIANYLIGVCLAALGDAEAALAQFARTASADQDTPEGLAAGLEEAEGYLSKGLDESALEAFRRLLQLAGSPDTFSNPWISLDNFRKRVEGAFQVLLERREFELAVDLTRAMSPLVPDETSVRLRADGQRAWARHLDESAQQLPDSQALSQLAESRAHFRKAGNAFSRLARLRAARRDFTDDLWNSGQCYALGRSYSKAEEKLQQYLLAEPRRRRAEGLVSLAEVRVAMGGYQAALDALHECLQYHSKDPQIYRARLVACNAHLERGETEQARQMLRENLENEILTPRSQEWRESLFQLGALQFREAEMKSHQAVAAPAGRSGAGGANATATVALTPAASPAALNREELYGAYELVLETLGEALQRYPEARQAAESRYVMARTRRALANLDRDKLDSLVLDSSRGRIERQLRDRLREIILEMKQLREVLATRREASELTPLESSLYRNAFFLRADALFELGDFQGAMDEYSLAVNRLPQGPITLEAMVQIANCHRRLAQHDEARGTIKQAQYVLKRIPDDGEFARVSHYRRQEWEQLLDWLSTL